MNSAPPRNDPFLFHALHILALYSVAVAQPLYDVLGKSPEFFVAHRLGAGGLILFVSALSFGIPAVLVLIEGAVRLISSPAQRVLHLGYVFILSACICAPIANRASALPSHLALGVAVVCGAGLTAAYAKFVGCRRFVSVLGLGAIVFPVMLLGFSPVRALIAQSGEAQEHANGAASITNPVPIVFVIFDEFEAGALLDENKEIDPVRYPNFAALARESWWFPRATTVWTETQRAVPAILTGLRPTSVNPPNYRSHPNNLFSWLQDSYRLNVTEPLTSLCPPKACRRSGDAGFRPDVFVSDLVVLYLHMVLPPAIASDVLPSIEDGWAGFAVAGHSNGADEWTFQHAMKGAADARGEQFQTFLDGIEGGNTLNFLHILLPHIPHVYLPDGSAYPGQGIEGLVDKIWVSDPYFATLAYHRFLLQAGFVDTLVGKLVTRLKASGLYDASLIVIAADHGRSFLPGQRLRAVAPPASHQAASQVLQVPLFVKLPGQKEGRRSERMVHTVDIVPTIADVLKSALPWKSDGTSMIAARFPERRMLEIPSLGSLEKGPSFALDELTSYPNLASKIGTFGSRTPLGRLAIKSPYSSYLGKPVADLSRDMGDSGLEADVEHYGLFQNVDLSSHVVPALLRGEVKGRTPNEGPLHLAMALNGKVEAVTRTAAWSGKRFYFAVVLPQQAFRRGENRLEIFAINDRDGKETVSPVALPTLSSFKLVRRDEKDLLIPQEGEAVPVDPDAALGRIEMARTQSGLMVLTGWAVDRKSPPAPAAAVVLFADGRQVVEGRTGRRRADLVKVLNAESALKAGFALPLSRQHVPHGTEFRAFAVTKDGRAGELEIAKEAQEALDGAGS